MSGPDCSSRDNELRVVIVGASPDRLNHNAVMRRHVWRGFATLLGQEAAFECPLEAAVETVRRLRPQLVVCFGSCMPDVADYGSLRDICDRIGCGLAFWLHDDPYEFDYGYRAANVADWLFSNDRWATLHHSHPRVFHLPLAACPESHLRNWTDKKQNDVFFCGVAFPNRQQLIRDLEPFLAGVRSSIVGAEWPDTIRIAENRRLTNMELSDSYARSWVTLNIGRNLHLANTRYQLDPSTPGPRTFEAALAGTVQMYFAESLEIADYFEVGEEILLFDSPEDCSSQIDELVKNPAQAKKIVEAARARAMRDHTYAKRAEVILDRCGLMTARSNGSESVDWANVDAESVASS